MSGKRTETRRFPACSTAQIIFTRGEFGLAKRLSGFAVCGGSLLNGNRYRDCKPRKRVRNENEREKERERKGRRVPDGERTQTQHLVDKRMESARCASGIRHFYVKIGHGLPISRA